jgi:hypothetical protein
MRTKKARRQVTPGLGKLVTAVGPGVTHADKYSAL